MEDSLKIFKVDGGGDGVDGTDAVIAFLTNESHTFAADSSGAIAVYDGGSTDMEVFEGITNVTSNYVISSSNGAGVSASDSGNTVTISAMTADSANVNINASSGSVSIDKIMSLVKSKQGPDGDDGTSAKLLIGSLDSQVMAFDDVIDTSATPSSIEFSFQQQNLAAPISASDVTIQMNGGGNITNFTFVNTDAVSGTGIVSGSVSFAGNTNAGGMGSDKSKFPLTISATKDSLQDAVKIFKVEGGSDGTSGVSAITALLTNDSHTLPVTSSIGVISYAGASTDILVFQGTSDVTNDYIINTGSISSHITTTTSGDTVTITNSTTPFSGSVEITATSGSVVLTKLMSISQALQGDDGSDGTPGANAKTLSVTADSQIFTFSSASNTTVPDDNTIEFFFSQQNLSGTIGSSDITVTDNNGNDITNNPSLSPSSLSGGSGVVSGSYVFATNLANDAGKFPCTVTVSKDGLTDSFKVFAISGGTDGVSSLQYLLSNEAHIVPAASNGVVSSYTNSETEIYVYEGTTELVYDGVGTSNGTWKINTPTVSPSGKITVGDLIDEGNYLLVKNHSAMDNSTDSVTISYPIIGKTTDGTSFSFTKTQTIAKSKEGSDGLPGTSASLISLTGDSQVFAFADASATTPDDNKIELFITQQNLGKTLTASDITIIDAIGGSHTVPTFAPTSLSNNSGVISGSLVFNTNSPSPKSKYPITITATSGSLSDSFKVFALDGGADGTSGEDAYTVFLTNESHTFPAAANGDVDSSNLAAGATDVRIFKGTTQLTNDNNSPYGANTYRATSAVSGITMSSTKPGTDRRFTPTAVTNDSGTATITITDNTTGTVFTKTYTFSKSKEGAVGAAGSGSKTVSLTATANVVTYDADGLNPSPAVMSPITLTANTQNFTNAYFKFTGDFNGLQSGDSQYTDGTSANQDTFSWNTTASYFSSPKTIRVGVSEAADSTTELTFDTVTIAAIKPGAGGVDAVTAFLTSEADVVPAATNGDVSSFNGSGTEMFIYEGVTNVSSNYTVTNNNSTGLTATISNRILTITALTPDSGSVILTAASGGVSISKTYSIAKSKAGAQGDQGANNQDFSYLDASLTGIGPISSPGLLMNSDVFGFHNGISGTNGSLSDFTSFLDDSGNFYLGGNSSGMSGSASTSGYLAWNNTDRSLLISGSNANIEVDKFFLGTGTSQYISGSNGNVEIAGDVTFRGRPDNGDGNVVFFDDFSQYSDVGDTDGGNAPKFDGTGNGWYWAKGYSTSTPSLVADTDCISGKALVVGNNNGDDEINIHSNQLIPFNESSLYEVEVRIKRTAGTSTTNAYVGISGMQSDGTTKVGYDGGSSESGHYITLSANNLGNGSGTGYFQTFKGYFKGATRTGLYNYGDTSMHDDKTDPGTLRTEINNGFIRAYLLLNYNDTQGITHVDYIKIKEFSSGGTSRISGDSITTGVIKSNNLSGTVGSQFKLDDGTFKLGGTTSPKLEWNGTTLSVKGNIQVEGGGFGSGAGELFGNPTGHLLRNDGRPGGWRAGYTNDDTSTIKSTDLGDGNGNIVELSSTTDPTIGMASHAFPIEVQQDYKINVVVKADANNTDGFYLRIYEYDSELPAGKDSICNSSDGINTSEPEVEEDTRPKTVTFYADDGTTTLGTENGGITTSYVSYNGTYTPTATAKYFSVVLLNWSQMDATATKLFLKSMNVRKVSQGTTITGEGISTGKIESVNLNPDSGSRIDLDNGSMIMGGTASPGFEITQEGFVTATNIVEKYVTVTAANSGSYYQTNSSHTTLVLDGSLGGSVTMNLTLAAAPPYVINDIVFPSNAGDNDIARLELTVQANGIQFDDGTITSGYSSYGVLLQSYTLAQNPGNFT